jgi:hypothetical protein
VISSVQITVVQDIVDVQRLFKIKLLFSLKMEAACDSEIQVKIASHARSQQSLEPC